MNFNYSYKDFTIRVLGQEIRVVREDGQTVRHVYVDGTPSKRVLINRGKHEADEYLIFNEHGDIPTDGWMWRGTYRGMFILYSSSKFEMWLHKKSLGVREYNGGNNTSQTLFKKIKKLIDEEFGAIPKEEKSPMKVVDFNNRLMHVNYLIKKHRIRRSIPEKIKQFEESYKNELARLDSNDNISFDLYDGFMEVMAEIQHKIKDNPFILTEGYV